MSSTEKNLSSNGTNSNNGTALAATAAATPAVAIPAEPGFLALANSDFNSLIAEELNGLELTFDRIKTPKADGITFEVPGDDGEPDPVKEFTGCILLHHTMNGYYKSDYVGGNNPPDCASYDGVTGIGDPGGACKMCPNNQFGSGKNNSKACKQKRRLYVQRDGDLFPMLMSIPPCSCASFSKYVKRVLGKGKRTNEVLTRFSIKRETSKNNMTYAQIQFSIVRPLTPEEMPLIASMTEQVKAYSQRVAFDRDAGIEDEIIDPETGEVIQPLVGQR